jgi:nucleotide-binding universal stress UspA family protein
MTGMTYDIVAGYDGSPGSAQAVRWAASEALARGMTLTVCLAWRPDHMELASQPATWELAGQDGKKILACGLPYAELVLGPGRVHAELVGGSAAQVLCERSRTAEMVVVGSRGHGKLPGLRLRSVSWHVAGHASGRVVIVGGRWRPVNEAPGPVVVGVDGSAASQAALTFAFEEAALRDVPLEALCALADAPGVRLGEMRLIEDDFNHAMACEEKEHPDIAVVRKVAAGTPRSALLTAAARSQMLITGCRGRGGFEDTNLGSVAQAVAHYSPCPVGIVHPRGCQPGQGWDDAVDGGSTISGDAVVALSWAIDTATDRGDTEEAARLASLQGAELNRWLEAHGYPRLREDEPGSHVE